MCHLFSLRKSKIEITVSSVSEDFTQVATVKPMFKRDTSRFSTNNVTTIPINTLSLKVERSSVSFGNPFFCFKSTVLLFVDISGTRDLVGRMLE
jgi:hypothetical protein